MAADVEEGAAVASIAGRRHMASSRHSALDAAPWEASRTFALAVRIGVSDFSLSHINYLIIKFGASHHGVRYSSVITRFC
jgi:hypothetical protein